MNSARMRERGMQFTASEGARLRGFRLVFDKASKAHPDIGHANLVYDRQSVVEGVLYRLLSDQEIVRMDPFENAPINYSREVVQVIGGVSCWTYFANPGVRRQGLAPSRSYLNHLLAGKTHLSDVYYQKLCQVQCLEDR